MTDKTQAILAQRGAMYGDFTTQACIEQDLMNRLVDEVGWDKLLPHEKSALQMVCIKMARIINGKTCEDNWRDIAGYATLAADRCQEG